MSCVRERGVVLLLPGVNSNATFPLPVDDDFPARCFAGRMCQWIRIKRASVSELLSFASASCARNAAEGQNVMTIRDQYTVCVLRDPRMCWVCTCYAAYDERTAFQALALFRIAIEAVSRTSAHNSACSAPVCIYFWLRPNLSECRVSCVVSTYLELLVTLVLLLL